MVKTVPVKVQSPSGVNLSFQNLITSKPGTIVPLVCREVIPSRKGISLSGVFSATLPPLAFDAYMRVSLKVQAFFVPSRILCKSFESFFTGEGKSFLGPSGVVDEEEFIGLLPYMKCDSVQTAADLGVFERGTLADYLGMMKSPEGAGDPYQIFSEPFSIMPFLAYHRLYEDWFRNTKIQKSIYAEPYNHEDLNPNLFAAGSRDMFYNQTNDGNELCVLNDNPASIPTFVDGVKLTDLRQCNFEDDYFTICTPEPSESDVKVEISSDDDFSIAALRAANAMQLYADRHNIAGPRYQDRLRSDYNAELSNGVAQRSLLLGSGELDVYTKGIYQNNSTATPGSTNNPFESVGARYGDAYASGEMNLIDNFVPAEPGYIMVVAELVPRVQYSSGIDRKFHRYIGPGSIVDMANPMLQGIGNQPVFCKELDTCSDGDKVFGYTERYADWKTARDEVHGLVADGENLSSMVLQRSFRHAVGDGPQISDSFIKIPTNYMDNVTAVTAQVSQFGYQLDCYFRFGAIVPLSPYAIPTLEDVSGEHQDTVLVRQSGQRIP